MKNIQILYLIAIIFVAFASKVKIHQQTTQAGGQDKSALSLQLYNLHATQWRSETLTKFTKSTAGYQSIRTTKPLRKGTIFQVTIKIWVGTYLYFGFTVNPDNTYSQYMGQTQNSWGYYCYDGTKYTRATSIPYATKCGPGDTIKIRIDLTQTRGGTVEYFLNGNSLGLAWGGLLGLNKDIYFGFGGYYAQDSVSILSHSAITPA